MFYVGLWKDMFWSEVRSIEYIYFLHIYTDIYIFVIVEYSAIIENDKYPAIIENNINNKWKKSDWNIWDIK